MARSKLFTENMRMALETLRTHKVRSFLTVLGVFIGTTVAIVVASILIGVQDNITNSLNEFGVNNIWIFRFNMGVHFGRMSMEERMRKPISFEDAMAIKDECSAVKNVSVQVWPRSVQGPPPVRSARYKGHEVTNIDFYGVTPSYAEVDNGAITDGRFYGEAENEHRADVAVIGADIAKSLFPNEEPVGKELQVDGNMYEVIGVFDKKKNSSFGGDSDVAVPYRTYRKRYPNDDEHFVSAMAYPGMKDVAEDQIRGILRLRRHVAPNQPDNFGLSSAEQLSDQFKQLMAGVLQLVVAVVSIGLLVGGVGVMNIMLMSVTERTREIGVRKAIGARKRDISFQFITEAIALTGVGGGLGVILSLIISFILQAVKFPSAVPIWAIVIAVVVSCSVGLFFGIYPAVKAARLDPVIALRYE